MNLIDVLAQPRMLIACAVFAAVNLLLARAERRFLVALSEHSMTAWLSEHIYLPLGRVFAVLMLIALAYPVLFGVHDAPGILQLLRSGEQRVSHLVNVGFLLSLLLPFVPVFGRLPGLVLPVQALFAAAMLFHWLAQAHGVEAALWPGWLTAILIVVWLVLAHRLASFGAGLFTDHSQPDGADWERTWYETALVFFQIPAVLLYTVRLGQQLH